MKKLSKQIFCSQKEIALPSVLQQRMYISSVELPSLVVKQLY